MPAKVPVDFDVCDSSRARPQIFFGEEVPLREGKKDPLLTFRSHEVANATARYFSERVHDRTGRKWLAPLIRKILSDKNKIALLRPSGPDMFVTASVVSSLIWMSLPK